jgi:phosphoribosylaminoimidazole-succinocarboxamide synthase
MADQERKSSGDARLPAALEETNLTGFGELYRGKVRDSYATGQGLRVLIATDRLSAFDRIVTTVPLKGQVLTQLARYWFERTAKLVENHVVAVPDPCAMVVREVSIVPIEVVVRGYLAGSGWRDYSEGRDVSGVKLPAGLREFSRLPEPVLTPSTKAAYGEHDAPISEKAIIESGIVAKGVWEEVREKALSLFSATSRELEARGLIFVDTKYEFGMLDGRVVLADEIHTLDSSRFWVAATYEERLARGEAPEMLDKQPVRRWLMDRGFSGDGSLPAIDDSYRAELMTHYIRSYEVITGLPFVADTSPPAERLEANLRRYQKRDV